MTYRKKLLMLGLAFLLAILLVYSLALKRTLGLKKQCDELTLKLNNNQNIPQLLFDMNNKSVNLQTIVGNSIINQDNIQELILEECSQYGLTNRTVLKNLPRPHKYQTNTYMIETCIVEVEGEFNDLLVLLYRFEQVLKLGKVVSVQFIKEEDRMTKENHLYLKMYIQNIKKNNQQYED
jgi:hypothetical protein